MLSLPFIKFKVQYDEVKKNVVNFFLNVIYVYIIINWRIQIEHLHSSQLKLNAKGKKNPYRCKNFTSLEAKKQDSEFWSKYS